MAEGADGEEEIQFLRTVSDAVCLFSTIRIDITMYNISFLYFMIDVL